MKFVFKAEYEIDAPNEIAARHTLQDLERSDLKMMEWKLAPVKFNEIVPKMLNPQIRAEVREIVNVAISGVLEKLEAGEFKKSFSRADYMQGYENGYKAGRDGEIFADINLLNPNPNVQEEKA